MSDNFEILEPRLLRTLAYEALDETWDDTGSSSYVPEKDHSKPTKRTIHQHPYCSLYSRIFLKKVVEIVGPEAFQVLARFSDDCCHYMPLIGDTCVDGTYQQFIKTKPKTWLPKVLIGSLGSPRVNKVLERAQISQRSYLWAPLSDSDKVITSPGEFEHHIKEASRALNPDTET